MIQKINAVVQASVLNDNCLEYFECIDCNKAVKNLICPDCMAVQVKVWIEKYPNIKKKIKKELDVFLKKGKNYAGHFETCIKCKRANAYLCPDCFSKVVNSLLEEAKAKKKILEEFEEMFNYKPVYWNS